MKFTQAIKDNWLLNLKSGRYKQGTNRLYYDIDNTYCCIGVLGDCTEGLENYSPTGNPYDFLKNTIGYGKMLTLTHANDSTYNPNKPDYKNVIPLIEALPVEEE